MQNPWQQFFVDNELRTCIQQDVTRTFPELEYFQVWCSTHVCAHAQSDATRQIMCDVLFVYARHHPHIEYKQGMHEILGPLMFVMYFDHQAYAHSADGDQSGLHGLTDDARRLLRTLQDARYLEHDC